MRCALAAQRTAPVFQRVRRLLGSNCHDVRMVSRPRAGDLVGSFRLLKKLRSGGNADVYEATSGDGSTVALKVLRNRSGGSEPYRRFRQEVAKHHELSEARFEGVLPLVDFDLPDDPTDERPPWMAMPIALPIESALRDGLPLEVVVMALAEIAETLARLHAVDVAHRDIKPSNLYRYHDAWVISDFGLVDIPGGAPLTVGAKALGPRHFIAPEMTLQPDKADGRAADVYSLGKTLWCLAAGLRTPPPGEHRRDLEWKRLSTWGVAHPRAFYLDQLIEQTSVEVPGDRPPMTMVARTLAEWAKKPPEATPDSPLDVVDLTNEIADVLGADRRRREKDMRRNEQVEEVVAGLAAGIAGFVELLNRANLPNSGLTSAHAGVSAGLQGFADELPGADRVAAWRSVAVERNTGRDQRHGFLRSGVAAALAIDQTMALGAVHTIAHAGGHETVWKDVSDVVLFGSPELDREIQRLSGGFMAEVPQVLARYLAIIRGDG